MMTRHVSVRPKPCHASPVYLSRNWSPCMTYHLDRMLNYGLSDRLSLLLRPSDLTPSQHAAPVLMFWSLHLLGDYANFFLLLALIFRCRFCHRTVHRNEEGHAPEAELQWRTSVSTAAPALPSTLMCRQRPPHSTSLSACCNSI
jgi:hypothetical protein